MSTGPTPAREVAVEVVRRVFELGAYADLALATVARRAGISGRERAFAQHLAYGAVRRSGTSDHFINLLARPRNVHDLDVAVRSSLRLGIFEVLYSGSADHAAVDQAVELAKRSGAGRTAGFVNAVLRRAVRERDKLLGSLSDASPAEAAIKHSVPEWLAELWWEELGPQDAVAVMAAANEPAETSLRVNTLRGEPAKVASELSGDEVEVRPSGAEEPLGLAEGLIAEGPLDLSAEPAFTEGRVTPQSRASMAVGRLLDPRPGEKVLDMCAAPGVKTTHVAARMGNRGSVRAVDRNPDRRRALEEMCERLGASIVDVVEGDAAEGDFGRGYDRVLVDPPCSDLGTLASRPDARWRKSAEQVEQLAGVQARILQRGIAALGPGGTLVYSTCTISRRENSELLGSVAANAGSAVAVDDLGAEFPALADPADPRFLQIRPDRDGTDGFFVGRLRKAA